MEDRIESSTEIRASVERVRALVSEPGWWINSGALGGLRIERDGSQCVVHDEKLGPYKAGESGWRHELALAATHFSGESSADRD